MQIRTKKTHTSFFSLECPKVYFLLTHRFLSQPWNMNSLPVQWTAEQETGRNMEGVGEEEEEEEGWSVCVDEVWWLV